MPVTPTYPGVYIEEVPSGVRTITGVSTSVAAFIGYFKKGPMNKAVQIFNMGDFERVFGGLDSRSEAGYAIQQFFLNGGQEAWVVRTARGNSRKAEVTIKDGINGSDVLTLEAISDGTWGNNLRVSIDHNTSEPENLFNLTVSEYSDDGANVVRSEMFLKLSMNNTHQRYVKTVINDDTSGSKLIRVQENAPIGTNLPLQNGTVSGILPDPLTITSESEHPKVEVTIGTEKSETVTLDRKPINPSEARSLLESAIRSSKPENPAFAEAKVEIQIPSKGSLQKRLRILAGPTRTDSRVIFDQTEDPTVEQLKLGPPAYTRRKGIISGDLSNLSQGVSLESDTPAMNVTIGTETRTVTLAKVHDSLSSLREALEKAIHSALPPVPSEEENPAFKLVRVAEYEDENKKQLIVIAGVDDNVNISFGAVPETDTTTIEQLKFKDAPVRIFTISGNLTPFPTLKAPLPSVKVTIGNEFHIVTFTSRPNTLTLTRTRLEDAIRSVPQEENPSNAFKKAIVAKYSNDREKLLLVAAGNTSNAVSFAAAEDDTTTVTELKLDSEHATANLQEYKLGENDSIPDTAQGAGQAGQNGSPPDAKALIGDLNSKTGIYALEDVDLFNILCIPRTAIVSGSDLLEPTEAFSVMAAANTYCGTRRAFFIIDPPNNINDVQGIKDWLEENATLRHKNSALYFPRIRFADPMNEFRLRTFGPSGTIAGLYARTDSTRGVWKAPAGTEASLVNVQGLDYTLTDKQNGTLNPLGINCIRNLTVYGNVCWGARTLDGADQMASEWKYIPIRRIALFIEESLFRGIKWAVFEPNDEPLWDQLRLNIRSFMMNLFRKGAFQGSTPSEAFFVKCDKETTTQDDINLGIVNILVGFAPLKPAEFVILKISQKAGQSVT
ncbi:MAG: phage tail sheath C-terminal domain-containing protein [bacterium]